MTASRRTYREASVARQPEGHAVLLDDRALRSPANRPFLLPTAALAEAIAAEWGAQGETIAPATMPLMQIAATAVDRVEPAAAETVAAIARYAETDLLCYRADAPAALVERQQQRWQPVLDWASLALDAPFQVTTGVVPLAQPAAVAAAVLGHLTRLDPFRLAALSVATAAMGSVVLALALDAGRIDAETAAELSQLDERFQAEQWGSDAEAAAARASLAREIGAAARFLGLLAG